MQPQQILSTCHIRSPSRKKAYHLLMTFCFAWMYSPSWRRGKPSDFHCHLIFVTYTTASATSSDYWPDLLCGLFFEAIRNRGNSSLFVTKIKIRIEKMPHGYLKQLLHFSISDCSAVVKNSSCSHWTRLIPILHSLG